MTGIATVDTAWAFIAGLPVTHPIFQLRITPSVTCWLAPGRGRRPGTGPALAFRWPADPGERRDGNGDCRHRWAAMGRSARFAGVSHGYPAQTSNHSPLRLIAFYWISSAGGDR